MWKLEELTSRGLVQNHKIPTHSASIKSTGQEMLAGDQTSRGAQ